MRQLRLVIVEDEPLIALDIATMVEDAGHTIVGQGRDCESGQRAVEATRPDAVLLDVNLGDAECDGVDLALRLAGPRTTPVIFITSVLNPADPRLKRLGRPVILSKPVDERRLRSTLREIAA
jgi:two-component system, response regulator PdtaR